jgi:diadenosine tetraphosphate (Ap4A) HIT family hydrolase
MYLRPARRLNRRPLGCQMIEVLIMECWTCRSNSGEKRISPGPIIYEGKYWLVEHAYPIKVKGWLVIVLKRHAIALHELLEEEFTELSIIQSNVIEVLHKELNCEKEYVSCYAEKGHFNHIHFHVFAKPKDLPVEYLGTKSFKLIDISQEEAIPKKEIISFCNKIRELLHNNIMKT